MNKAQEKNRPTVYHFNVGVTVDAKDEHPMARYEPGDEVSTDELPPHIDLQGLIHSGAVKPVEEVVRKTGWTTEGE